MSDVFGKLDIGKLDIGKLDIGKLDILGLPALYVVPVSIVFIACLVVFALGFKSSAPLPPSFDVTDGSTGGKKKAKHGKQTVTKLNPVATEKSKQTSAKVASTPKAASKVASNKSESKSVEKRNVPKEKQEKPKAVVKPLPAEESVEVNEVDIDGGDWIPVLSEKQKKKAASKAKETQGSDKVSNKGSKSKENETSTSGSKKKSKKNANNGAGNQELALNQSVKNVQELALDQSVKNVQELTLDQSVNKAANEAVVEKVLAKIERIENKAPGQLTSQMSPHTSVPDGKTGGKSGQYTSVPDGKTGGRVEVEEWRVEDPDPYMDSKTRGSNQVKKMQQKMKQRKESEGTVALVQCELSGEEKHLPSDKITKEIITSYDGQSDSQTKSKKKKSQKEPVPQPVLKPTGGDKTKSTPSKTPKPEVSKVAKPEVSKVAKPKEPNQPQPAPKVPSDSGSSTHSSVSVVNPPTTSSDVTDATVSDQSEGEFKVVQRKPRKPKSKPSH